MQNLLCHVEYAANPQRGYRVCYIELYEKYTFFIIPRFSAPTPTNPNAELMILKNIRNKPYYKTWMCYFFFII